MGALNPKSQGVYRALEARRSTANTTTPGEAIVTKVTAEDGLTYTYTGVDAGTGDVVIKHPVQSKVPHDVTLYNIKVDAYGHVIEGSTDPGAAGTQGNQGDIGLRGVQGYQGVRGYQGTQGITGAVGNQGYQGGLVEWVGTLAEYNVLVAAGSINPDWDYLITDDDGSFSQNSSSNRTIAIVSPSPGDDFPVCYAVTQTTLLSIHAVLVGDPTATCTVTLYMETSRNSGDAGIQCSDTTLINSVTTPVTINITTSVVPAGYYLYLIVNTVSTIAPSELNVFIETKAG